MTCSKCGIRMHLYSSYADDYEYVCPNPRCGDVGPLVPESDEAVAPTRKVDTVVARQSDNALAGNSIEGEGWSQKDEDELARLELMSGRQIEAPVHFRADE